MRVLWIPHLSIVEERPLGEAWHWLDAVAPKLTVEAVFFDRERHRLQDFDCLHFFARDDAETWSVSRASNRPVVVTPGFATTAPLKTLSGPPIERRFFGAADLYLIPPGWKMPLTTRWRVRAEKVRELPSLSRSAEAINALATCFDQVYSELVPPRRTL